MLKALYPIGLGKTPTRGKPKAKFVVAFIAMWRGNLHQRHSVQNNTDLIGIYAIQVGTWSTVADRIYLMGLLYHLTHRSLNYSLASRMFTVTVVAVSYSTHPKTIPQVTQYHCTLKGTWSSHQTPRTLWSGYGLLQRNLLTCLCR